MNDIFDEHYFDSDLIATEGIISDYFKRKSAEREAAVKRERQASIRISKSQFDSMSKSEMNIAWTKLIRLVMMYGCLPSSISSKNSVITDYDLYGTAWSSYNMPYEKGIAYMRIAANNQFTNSDDMLEYMKEYIERDIEEERRKEAQRERERERLSQEYERLDQERREQEYLDQLKRANNANIRLTNAQSGIIDAQASAIRYAEREKREKNANEYRERMKRENERYRELERRADELISQGQTDRESFDKFNKKLSDMRRSYGMVY